MAGAVYKMSQKTWSSVAHFASFPQTGISLRQMVQFGRNPNPGTIMQAGNFLAGTSTPLLEWSVFG
jgi:pyruvate dehydrogenase kinase 2/3/4